MKTAQGVTRVCERSAVSLEVSPTLVTPLAPFHPIAGQNLEMNLPAKL